MFISGLMIFASCHREPEALPVDQLTLVEAAPVIQRKMAIPIAAAGLLSLKQQLFLSFKTGGFISQISVREGQSVKAGQVLAQLDLSEIESQVMQSRSNLQKLRRDYERVKALYEDNVATLEQFQNIETAVLVAESTQRIAEFNLEHSTIKAPTDGQILRKLMEQGEMVSPGMPVLYFGAGGNEWVLRTGVADRDAVQLTIGDSARVEFDAFPRQSFKGSVSEISRAANPQSGTFEIEVTLAAVRQRLSVGFVGRCTLFPANAKDYFLAPIEAIVEAEGSNGFVFAVSGDAVHKIPVILGPVLNKDIVILQGVEDIDRVVTTGVSFVKDGERVRVK